MEKGLQKFTETQTKVNSLLAKSKIRSGEVDELLNEDEKDILAKILTDKINQARDTTRDKLLEQVDEILPIDTKNQLWENNHYLITASISKLIEEHGKMPTKNLIANDTGLSRQTIHKHLKSYNEHPLYDEQTKQFKFIFDRVLAKVIKLAIQGNIKAARLYFDVMGNISKVQLQTTHHTLIQSQNNYIQINETVLNQESIKYLNSEQLNTIESILRSAVPQCYKSKTNYKNR